MSRTELIVNAATNLSTFLEPLGVVREGLKGQIDALLRAGALCSQLDVMWVGFGLTLLHAAVRQLYDLCCPILRLVYSIALGITHCSYYCSYCS